ncbi:Recoverin family protein DDB_G0274781 [Durusdinium trenchii]|uniref:Recoverin family protein DDB_G0274781 n=1 Tax=Durusdinium trenchii TaxID=1381693 RepID=A0ABP0R6C1_9DINO
MSRSLWISAGMDTEELSKTLCASLGLPDDAVEGVFVSDNGRSFGLEHICRSPSSFAAYRGIHVILADDDDDDDDDEEEEDMGAYLDSDSDSDDSSSGDVELRRDLVPIAASGGPGLTEGLEIGAMFKFETKDIANIMKMFAEQAPDGYMTHETFSSVFHSFLKQSYRGDPETTGRLLERLFQVFDKAGDGRVSATEFLSGLTTLSSGSRDEKIRMAFSLFDYNGDGFIQLNEMVQYLSSVFTVIQQTSSEVFEKYQISPDELARVTAEQCFLEADLDADGRLSWQEFRRWYESEPNLGSRGQQEGQRAHALQHASSTEESTVSLVTNSSILRLSKLLKFDQFAANEVFDVFSDVAHDGSLDRRRFRDAYETLLRSKNMRVDPRSVQGPLDKVFDIFDEDSNGLVDFEELGSGLSVLCAGSREDKVRAAFDLYDYNKDGYITVDEMISYMTSVFKILYATSPQVSQSMQRIDPEELAEVTTKACFAEADTDGDGRLSFDEFCAWYTRPSAMPQVQPPRGPPVPPPRTMSSDSMPGMQGSLASQGIGLERIRHLTGVDRFEIFQVFDEFARRVNDKGHLTWPAYKQAFQAIRDRAGIRHTDEVQARLFGAVLRRLWELFDRDGNGVLDFREIASGVGVLCRPSSVVDEKTRAVFSLFDQDGSGFIDPNEMFEMLLSIYVVMFDITGAETIEGLDPVGLARKTTMDAFLMFDKNVDAKLSFAEFSEWYLSPDGAGGGAGAPIRDASIGGGLEEVRALTGLNHVSIEDALSIFSDSIDTAGSALSRAAFQRAFSRIVPATADRGRVNLVLDRIFELFAQDECVDFRELMSALTILCSAEDPEERAETCYNLFDTNGDGVIQYEECAAYLASVYKLMFEVEPDTVAMANNVTPEVLAQHTTEEVFRMADTDQNGVLSWDEFRAWFTGKPQAASVAAEGGAAQDDVSSWITLEEVRRLTCLDQYTAEEAFERLADVSDEDGLLDKQAFFTAFHRIIVEKGGIGSKEDRVRVNQVLHRLFDTLDQNKDGRVDFAELSAGVSILCGASDGDGRVRAVFELFDINGDGFIDIDELRRYLTCVFRVMYETQPETRAKTGYVEPEDLANQTAQQVMRECDRNHDNRLSFEEFRVWYSQDAGQQLSVAATLMAQDSDWFNLEEIRRLTNIHHHDPRELLRRFAEAAREHSETDDAGTFPGSRLRRQATSNMFITRESFDDVLHDMIDEEACCTEDDFVRLTFILDRLYDMFDINGDGRVDFSELSSGLLVLAGEGETANDRIAASFALFDENGDGFISLPEMIKFLTSTYRVLFEIQPDLRLRAGNVTADQLARATAEQAFIDADLNDDGKLSFEEFQRWYSQPTGQAVSTLVENTPSFISMDEIRQLTKIDRYAPDDIRDQFDCFANDQGEIDKAGFMAAFEEIVAEASDGAHVTGPKQARLRVVLERLFEAFDTNKDGLVDARELNAGLSILNPIMDRDAKAQLAFELWDLDGSGGISLSEVQTYLTSVFVLMFETQPGLAERVGTSPQMLASATAAEIFASNNLREDQELDFATFKRWYEQGSGAALTQLTEDVPRSLSIAEIRQITRFDQYTPSDVLELFARRARDGTLDRHNFEQAFREAAMAKPPPLSREESALFHVIAQRLFNAFDTNHSGVIEFMDLAAGLSIISGGDKRMRASTCFTMYDRNGDGFISFEEMYIFLTAVFKVLFELQPETRARMGDADPETVAEARRLSGLEHMDAADAFEEFAVFADELGNLDFDSFASVFENIMSRSSHSRSPEEQARADDMIVLLFELFDQDSDGSIDFLELASGLSVLCGGTQQEKCEAVFRLYDQEGTGFVTRESMEWYLTSVFRLMLETQEGAQKQLGDISAEDLAHETTNSIFETADLNHDGQLSFDEFRRWFESNDSSAQAVNSIVAKAPSWISLEELKRITGLGAWSQRDIFEEFALAVDEDGLLARPEFIDVFAKFVDEDALDAADRARLPLVLSRLFDIMDTDRSGKVDFSELSAGLALLSRDSRDSKAEAAFSLFDEDDDGFIDRGELERYLASVFRLYLETSASARETAAGLTPEELAQSTAEQIFIDNDTNRDGRLSFEEFKAWYSDFGGDNDSNEAKVSSAQDGTASRPRTLVRGISVNDDEQSPDWLSLGEVKRITGFGSRSVHDLFEVFASFTNEEGVLTRSAFNQAFDALLAKDHRSPGEESKLSLVRARLFDIMDADGNGVVDFAEISSGLILLTDGPSQMKTAALFSLYDYDKNGFISRQEMVKVLTAMFRVIFETDPVSAKSANGASPEALAEACTEDIFRVADTNQDDQLSHAEFSRWYESSFGDGNTSRGAVGASELDQLSRDAIENVTIDEARRITGLGDMQTSAVFQEFALATDENGMLDREAFFGTFSDIVDRLRPNRSTQDEAMLQLVLAKLYHAFDADQNGLIDFTELAAGLSILCQDDRSSKVQQAFSLFDIDQDGFITADEMFVYLHSVYRTLFELMPGTKESLSVSAEDLARATTDIAFEEADLDGDGKISFEEFTLWFSGNSGIFGPTATIGSAEQLDNAASYLNGGGSRGEEAQDGPGLLDSSSAPMQGLAEVKRLTKLENLELDEVLQTVNQVAGGNPLSFQEFVSCFEMLIEQGGGHESYNDEKAAADVIRSLFNLFDQDGNGMVDQRELVSGLSILTNGSREDKVHAAFQLYDRNQDGKISMDEMVAYLSSVFRVLYAAQPAAAKAMGVDPVQLGVITAEQCFVECDADGDGFLSFEEFKEWYQRQ